MHVHTITAGTTRLELWRLRGRRRLAILPPQAGPYRWARALSVPYLGLVKLKIGVSRRVLATERAIQARRDEQLAARRA